MQNFWVERVEVLGGWRAWVGGAEVCEEQGRKPPVWEAGLGGGSGRRLQPPACPGLRVNRVQRKL